MMSIAACIALFQLIFKPHYWEKTEHGLHLGKKQAAGVPGPHADLAVVDEPTMLIARPGLSHEQQEEPVSSITAAFRAISTLPMPALSREERTRFQEPRNKGIHLDPWPIVTLIIACGASVSACWYFFQLHEILLYGDAYSHLMLARRFFDSQSPGFAQLGSVWLPLPQVAMLPFIWNDTLWRTGLAGSIPSMLGYIIASVCIFLAARRLTHNNVASFVGTLVFVLNPNILYLQSTPLSELVCIATSAMACYFFLAWAQDEKPQQLVCTAASIFLATLARYDGWALFVAMGVLIIVVGWIKHQRWIAIQGHLLVFGMFGGLGIVLWFLWNQIIFHDFLYFQKGPYSAQGQAIHIDAQQTYHNLWQAIRYYFFTSVDTCGPILFVLAAAALLIFAARKRLTVETVAVMTFLVPFAFYVLTIYTGQAGIFVPGAVPANSPQQLFDVRFGSETVAAIAICLAILAHYFQQLFSRRRPLLGKAGHILIALVVIVQSVLIATGGIITVQDGIYGGSCAFPHPINAYLAQHYDGGRVLEDTFTSNIDGADAGLLLKNVVYDGSGKMWINALQHPETLVDWIIVDPHNPKDIVAQHIDVNNPRFQQMFSLVYKENYGLSLYHRNGLPPLPTRLISPDLLQAHSLCK